MYIESKVAILNFTTVNNSPLLLCRSAFDCKMFMHFL